MSPLISPPFLKAIAPWIASAKMEAPFHYRMMLKHIPTVLPLISGPVFTRNAFLLKAQRRFLGARVSKTKDTRPGGRVSNMDWNGFINEQWSRHGQAFLPELGTMTDEFIASLDFALFERLTSLAAAWAMVHEER